MPNREEIRARISETLKQPLERVTDDTALAMLVTDSFVLVEVAIELQEEFDVRLSQEQLNAVKTVGDLIDLIAPA